MSFTFRWSPMPQGVTALRRSAPWLLILMLCAFLNPSSAQLPISTGAPYAGQKAPPFALPDQRGKVVSLADLLKQGPRGGKPGGVALIFYRGYW